MDCVGGTYVALGQRTWGICFFNNLAWAEVAGGRSANQKPFAKLYYGQLRRFVSMRFSFYSLDLFKSTHSLSPLLHNPIDTSLILLMTLRFVALDMRVNGPFKE